MQGTLGEIDIRSILQLIELGQRTGELSIETYPSSALAPRSWFVFFVNGRITYAAAWTNSNLSRLRDYLKPFQAVTMLQPIAETSLATVSIPEYACLWQLLEKNVLTPAQGRNIVQSMIGETLFDLLSLHQGAFIFEMGSALAPQLTSLEIAPLMAEIMQQVQHWKQFHPHIQHPDQSFAITNAAQLKSALPEKVYLSLSEWSERKTTLRQLSRYLRRELVSIAHTLYPYIERGWLQLFSHTANTHQISWALESDETPKPPHVVCIDDDLTIGRQVEEILQRHGYQATFFDNPLKALSLVFRAKPDLILCDITMPELDGYEICGMLRHSSTFRQTPIIMLTGKEAFTDRVRARMVGATDYLTKPFGVNELLLLLEKYTHSARDSLDRLKI